MISCVGAKLCGALLLALTIKCSIVNGKHLNLNLNSSVLLLFTGNSSRLTIAAKENVNITPSSFIGRTHFGNKHRMTFKSLSGAVVATIRLSQFVPTSCSKLALLFSLAGCALEEAHR